MNTRDEVLSNDLNHMDGIDASFTVPINLLRHKQNYLLVRINTSHQSTEIVIGMRCRVHEWITNVTMVTLARVLV